MLFICNENVKDKALLFKLLFRRVILYRPIQALLCIRDLYIWNVAKRLLLRFIHDENVPVGPTFSFSWKTERERGQDDSIFVWYVIKYHVDPCVGSHLARRIDAVFLKS
jgi:hypothetical protein